jgi:hypothetical protein
MCFACWMTEATDKHTEYIKLACPRQECLRERASLLRLYLHSPSSRCSLFVTI